MIYEPMGPTGDRRIPVRYAIPGQAGLPLEVFQKFLDDLQALRLQLGPQTRRTYARMTAAQRLIRSLIGSRTRISYLSAKFALGSRTLVWKDPTAAFAVPAVLARGIPAVICVRSPLAHAASFKRKGWKVEFDAIYWNFRDYYGPAPEIERLLASDRKPLGVANASMLWHLIYWHACRVFRGEFGRFSAPLLLVSGTELEANELQVYRNIYESLDLPFDGRPRRSLEKRAGQAIEDVGETTKTHDWGRSVSATNSYWKQTLDDSEIEFVQQLNSRIFDELESIGASGNSARPRIEIPVTAH
jgi:hypothetical protein